MNVPAFASQPKGIAGDAVNTIPLGKIKIQSLLIQIIAICITILSCPQLNENTK